MVKMGGNATKVAFIRKEGEKCGLLCFLLFGPLFFKFLAL